MRVFCGLKIVATFGTLDPATKAVKAPHAVTAELDELDPAKWGKILESLTEYRDAAQPKGESDGNPSEC